MKSIRFIFVLLYGLLPLLLVIYLLVVGRPTG